MHFVNNTSPSDGRPVAEHPDSRERLAEIERILERRAARQRAAREPDRAARLRALIEEGGR